MKRKYTGLLLYPDFMQNDGTGAETYLSHVWAESPGEAQGLMETEALVVHDMQDDQYRGCFVVLGVFEGWLLDVRNT